MAEPALLPLAWRLARRELRGGLRGFRIFLACLAIGVGAIAGVGSVAAALIGGLHQDARAILGGDVEFRLAQRELPPDVTAWLAGHGTMSEVREMRGMARRPDGDKRTLIELKAIDSAYPLYGAVETAPAMPLDRALVADGDTLGIVVDPAILDRLDLKLGDKLRLGNADFTIRTTLLHEPDGGANPFPLGPRVLIAAAGLHAAGLDQPGTLSATVYRLKLPPDEPAKSVIAAAEQAYPDAGWRARDFTNAAPSIQGFIDRTSLFLTLVGLTALMVGGVGVGNAVSSYLAGKVPVIATLKCLGAPARLIHAVYLLQILVLALLGIAIGLAVGAGAPWLLEWAAGAKLPVPLRLGLYPGPLLLATGFGVLTALGFSLWPLARARQVPAGTLFRSLVDGTRQRLRLGDWLATGLVGVALAGLAIATADDRRLAAWFVLAVAVSLFAFRAAGLGVMAAARRFRGSRRPWLRTAIANLHRPGASTPSVVLSMGLGLTVLVTVALVEGSLSHEVSERLPAGAPSYFFIDIQPDQIAQFEQITRSIPGISEVEHVPSLRARIAALNGVPADKAKVDPDSHWILQSERGLTYSTTLPKGSHLVAGEWWPADYTGPPLLSIEADLAHGLHLGLGDTVTFNVAGREVTGRIANLRKIDWTSLGINFFNIFSPGALENAPQTDIATAHADTPEHEAALARAVTDAFPAVSAIRVKDALDTVAQVLDDMATAVRAIAAITVLAGITVLSGAIAAGHRRRVYEAVVLKVLGATRAMVARGFLIEYGILGLVTAVIAVLLGTLAAWLVVTQVMKGEWVFAAGRVALTAGAGALVTLVIAFAGTWRALGAKAAPHLRSE
ncbi:MAG TPA: FtsX-like permease family protein [Aliidongia sp.]|nr:FtsX-like permease family protein [Aliidongia sp.]